MKLNRLSLIFLLIVFSCSAPKNNPARIEHAECLFMFTEDGEPGNNGKEVRSKDSEETWKWVKKDRWNYCKEKGFAYRIEFNEGDLYVVNMYSSSGGSGEFTNLILFEIKDGDFKLIESIAGGDRCQLGLVSEKVKFEDNSLIYSEWITPFHLMSWNKRELPFDAYDDCMICCIGSAKYKFNPTTRQKEFLAVELLDSIEGVDNNFLRTYNHFISEGKKILNENDIQRFIKMVENK